MSAHVHFIFAERVSTSGERRQCQHETAKWDDSQQIFKREWRDSSGARRFPNCSRVGTFAEHGPHHAIEVPIKSKLTHTNIAPARVPKEQKPEHRRESSGHTVLFCNMRAWGITSLQDDVRLSTATAQQKKFLEHQTINLALHSFGRFPTKDQSVFFTTLRTCVCPQKQYSPSRQRQRAGKIRGVTTKKCVSCLRPNALHAIRTRRIFQPL